MQEPSEPLTDTEVAAHDDQRAIDSDSEQRLRDWLRRTLPTGLVLDAGGGTGIDALRIADSAHQVIVCDTSARMLAAARNRDRRLRLIQADIAALPLSSSSLSGVHVANVLHLVPRWRHAIAELARLLTPEGAAVVKYGTGRVSECASFLATQAYQALGAAAGSRTDLNNAATLDQAFRAAGFGPPTVTGIEVHQRRSLRQLADRLADNPFGLPASPHDRRKAIEVALRATQRRYGDLDLPRPIVTVLPYRRYSRAPDRTAVAGIADA